MAGAMKFAMALALLACGMPSGSLAGRVPPIPAGHRAQYSLQREDGSFQYGWDTGRGATAQVEGDAANEVRGSYSPGPGLSVRYTAGVAGFVPTIVQDEDDGSGSLQQQQQQQQQQQHHHHPGVVVVAPSPPARPAYGVKTSWASPVFVPVLPATVTTAAEGVHGYAIGPAGPLQSDGTYRFAYTTADQARRESADAANNVRGSFSFRTKQGHPLTVNYVAGARTGFVAQGSHLPTPPPAAPAPGPDGDDGQWVDDGSDGQWSEPEPQPEPEPDAAYRFGYEASDASRQEESDAQGNVRGSFAYVGPDGVARRVQYEAGAGKGFVVTGDHLPTQDRVDAASRPRVVHTMWSAPGPQQRPVDGDLQQTWQPSVLQQQPTAGDLADNNNIHVDGQQQQQQVGGGAYSFAYSTPDQHREEEGDGRGNVRGSFSFVAPDDPQRKRVDYHAGAATGFVAKGEHLPKPQPSEVAEGAPSSPLSPPPPAGQRGHPHGPTEPAPTEEEAESGKWGGQPEGSTEPPTEAPVLIDDKIDIRDQINIRLGDDSQHSTDDSQQSLDDSQQQAMDSGDSNDGGEGSGSGSLASGDASYRFAYRTPDSSREEESDARGNVRGSFSFTAPDGVSRSVEYEAGAGKGFVAKGDHLPKDDGKGFVAKGDHLLKDDGQVAESRDAIDPRQEDDGQATQGPLDDDLQQKEEEEGVRPVAKTLFPASRSHDDLGHVVNGGPHGRSRGLGLGAPRPRGSSSSAVRTYLPPGVPGHKVGYVYEDSAR